MKKNYEMEKLLSDTLQKAMQLKSYEFISITLRYLKKDTNRIFSDQFYGELYHLYFAIDEPELRCEWIETILEFDQFEMKREIFIEYVHLIFEGFSNYENITRCLEAFLVSGLEKSTLLEHMSKSPYPDFAVELMASVGGDWETNNPALLEFVERINIKWRQNYRIGVITQLILVTHPAILSGDPFNGYKSVDAAIHDWAWIAADSTRNCLNRKIITVSESDQLIEIGQYIRSNPNIDTEKAKHLYDAFFGDRDPFDVMYDLPK